MATIENSIGNYGEIHSGNPWVEEMEPGAIYAIAPNKQTIANLRATKRDLEKRLMLSRLFNVILLVVLLGVTYYACTQFEQLNADFRSLSEQVEASREASKVTQESLIEYSVLRAMVPDEEVPLADAEEIDLSLYDDVPLGKVLKEYIVTSSEAAGIPPQVMFSLAWKESTFNVDAVSASDDHGLFQINRCNFKDLASHFGYTMEEFEEAIYDPFVNTDCSIYILDNYRDGYQNNNWHHVLMRYNMGPNGAQECFSAGKYSSEYSRDILNYAEDCFGFTDITF